MLSIIKKVLQRRKKGEEKVSKIDNKLKTETLALRGGQEPDPTTGSRAVPMPSMSVSALGEDELRKIRI
jgi:hypothetical protein